MPRHYLIMANKPQENDPFSLKEGAGCIVFYASSFVDISKTIRATSPDGLKRISPRKIALWLKDNYSVDLRHPLTKQYMYSIRSVGTKPPITKTLEYTHKNLRKPFTHLLKLTEVDFSTFK